MELNPDRVLDMLLYYLGVLKAAKIVSLRQILILATLSDDTI